MANEVIIHVKGDTAQAEKATDSLRDRIQRLSGPLKVVGAAFTALGAAGLKMADSAREMNAGLAQTAFTMGISTEEMRKLALATTDVSFPLKSVEQTLSLLARAGVETTGEMYKSAKAFDALGDATGSSAEQVAELLIPAFKLFGKEIPKTAAELDVFTWLTKNTTVNLEDFGAMLAYLAPEMGELGISMEDSVAMLAALSAKGIEGSAATRLLRTAITEASKEGGNLMAALGLTNEELVLYRGKLDEASGSTERYADLANTQFGLVDNLKQKFSELTLQLGSFLTPMEPIMAGMTALGPMMILLSTSTGLAAVKTAAHTIALIAHNVAMVAHKAVLGAVTVAQWLWNAAMAANPLGLLVAGIAALIAGIVLLIRNWDTVKDQTLEIWRTITNFLTNTWDSLVGFFKDAWGNIQGIFSTAIDFLKDLLLRFHPLGLIITHWTPLTDFFTGLWENIQGIFKEAINGLIGMAEGFANAFIGAINRIGQAIGSLGFDIPAITALGRTLFPGLSVRIPGLPQIPEITLPRLAEGGIITRPTLAMVGEQGPEAILPLFRKGLPLPFQEKGIITQPTLALLGERGPEAVIPLIKEGQRVDINLPTIPEISLPRLAEGGMIRQPTLAMLGERGPEAVVPLNQVASFSVKVTITNHGIIGIPDLEKVIFQAIRDGKRRGAFEGVIP